MILRSIGSKNSEHPQVAQNPRRTFVPPAYIVLQRDFPTLEQARAFLAFLEQRVWSTPANSPGLAGSPSARILVAAPAT